MFANKIKNLPQISTEKSLKTLVENRQIYSLNNCEMNVFETHEQAKLVPLKFSEFIVTSMLRGKKVMHLFDKPGFEYFPGQTVIVPCNVEMKIDFPNATANDPTQCLALAIDQNKITDTLSFLNNKYANNKNGSWKLDYDRYFFYNNEELADTINKLLQICLSAKKDKDIFADLALQELIVRIVQSQNLQVAQDEKIEPSNNSFLNIISFIKLNLFKKLNLKSLTSEACMSSPTLYRMFKKEIGISPIEFILSEKIKYAKKLLQNPVVHISNVGFESGFEDSNYFIRIFKKQEGITPKQYQHLCANKNIA
jgi:AraC-like DNA-binding protein